MKCLIKIFTNHKLLPLKLINLVKENKTPILYKLSCVRIFFANRNFIINLKKLFFATELIKKKKNKDIKCMQKTKCI